MAARKRTPARKASGENIGEWQRKTVAVKLRLAPEVAAKLKKLAAERAASVSDYVSWRISVDIGFDLRADRIRTEVERRVREGIKRGQGL